MALRLQLKNTWISEMTFEVSCCMVGQWHHNQHHWCVNEVLTDCIPATWLVLKMLTSGVLMDDVAARMGIVVG